MKRLIDVLGSGLLLSLLAPIMLACAASVKMSSPGPVLFKQERLGLRGIGFTLFKFRTMELGAPDLRNPDGSAFSSSTDRRVTKVGNFLRKTSLDELPQLVNIFRGNMSLVGPRPDQIDQLQYYTPLELRKLEAKPGLTGLAQINGRNSISWKQRKELDVVYVEQQSMLLDLSILCKTIPYVLQRRNLHANSD